MPPPETPITKKFTYGGYIQKGIFNPLKLQLIPPSNEPIRCDTFCGNCVLIPGQIAKCVGNIDPRYQHRWGDVDYGFRVKKKGFASWIAPGYFAECEANPMADRWRYQELTLREKIKELHSVKGLGKADWWKFVRNHGNTFWLLIGLRPYVRILYDTSVQTLNGHFLRKNRS